MLRRLLVALLAASLVLGPVHGAAPPGDGPTTGTGVAPSGVPSSATGIAPIAGLTADAGVAPAAGPPPAAGLGTTNASPAANEPPLADAGLDQTVPRDAVVLLDGRGSRDPDGTIAAFEWSIVAPDGTAIPPTCPDCPRTNFTAAQVGTYAVTLAVTDDDGATSNDTLYVTVSSGQGPAVTVIGPDEVAVGATANVTASITPGAAPLSTLQWTVAGTDLPAEGLADGQRVASLERTFPVPGSYTVTATVTDADGQTATGAHTVTVVTPSSPPGPGPGPGPGPVSPPGGPIGRDSSPIAATASPVVRGDQVVTGTRPLRGSYRLDVGDGRDDVSSVTWHAETGSFGAGFDAARSWAPGDHELFAVVRYRDGSRDVATFPDGDRRVVADPRPNLTLHGLAVNGSIRGAVTGSDAYGNLRSIVVSVDGEPVARWPTGLAGFRSDGARRKRLPFLYRTIDPGRPHDVTMVARDRRGQTATLQRRVTPVGRPVVVRSEFVNDPVDSYDERIDPERYTAHHVLVVELNGLSVTDVNVDMTKETTRVHRIKGTIENLERDNLDNRLVYHTYWSSDEPGGYEINIVIRTDHNEIIKQSEFRVTPSNPELRYTIVSDGTPDQGPWGAEVDASRSFDPDDTEIEYIWRLGANPISPDNATAKLSAYQLATLVVEDGYDLRARNEFFFESNYNPGFGYVEEVTEGPYRPNETVEFRVATDPYELPKNTYSVDLGLRTSSEAVRIEDWTRGEVMADNLTATGRYNYQDVGSKVWTATVTVRASALAREPGMPAITVYNTELPDANLDSRRLPAVEVLADAGTYRTNVEVTDIRYEVERPVLKTVTVPSPEAREQYLDEGYAVEERSHYGTEYLVEERVQVQSARYETRYRMFATARNRRVFLESNPAWHAAGMETEVEWRTSTEYEWRATRGGDGTFTGRTKRVLTSPAEYRTMHEYRYEYRTFDGRVVSGTYWAFRKRSYEHRPTGLSRRVQVADAEYETRYQYEVTDRERVTVVRYVAERRVQVQEARYEWQPYRRTTDEAYANQLADLNDDYRIGGSSPTYEWTLTKQVGTEIVVVDSYRNESNVLETRATVSGEVVRRYVNTRSSNNRREIVDSFEKVYTFEGVEDDGEIIESVKKDVK